MRSIVVLIILLLSLVGVYMFLETPVKTWGGPGKENICDACIYESYIYVLGEVYSQTGEPHIVVYKLSFSGHIVSSWVFSNASVGHAIFAYSMSIYVAGTVYRDSSEFGLLIKLNTKLNVTWIKMFREVSTISSVYVYINKIYLIGKNTTSLINYVMILDTHGNLQWRGHFENIVDIFVYRDDLYIVCAYSDGIHYVYLMSLSPSGEIFSVCDWIYPRDIKVENIFAIGDNVFVVGYLMNPSSKSYDVFVACFDLLSEDLAWNITWGGGRDDYGYSIAFSDLYLYITGETTSYNPTGHSDVFILKVGIDGGIIWSKTWGSFFSDDAGKSIVTYYDSIFVLGETCDSGDNYYDAFIMKIDPYGNYEWHILQIPKRGFRGLGFYLALLASIISLIYLINTRRITYILRKEHDYII